LAPHQGQRPAHQAQEAQDRDGDGQAAWHFGLVEEPNHGLEQARQQRGDHQRDDDQRNVAEQPDQHPDHHNDQAEPPGPGSTDPQGVRHVLADMVRTNSTGSGARTGGR
jgi:hypothetical protein